MLVQGFKPGSRAGLISALKAAVLAVVETKKAGLGPADSRGAAVTTGY